MNYSEFYKKAAVEGPAEIPGWKKSVDGVEGYQNHIPMLALLAGAGALGGYALSNKKKKGAGAAFGGLSLPALYLAYIAARRNEILPPGKKWDDYLDKGSKKVNDWGNQFNPWETNPDGSSITKTEAEA